MLLDVKLAMAGASALHVGFGKPRDGSDCVYYTYSVLSDDGTICTVKLDVNVQCDDAVTAHSELEKIRAAVLDRSGKCVIGGLRVRSVTEGAGNPERRDRFGKFILNASFIVKGRSQGVQVWYIDG